jgi:hypothetical protein
MLQTLFAQVPIGAFVPDFDSGLGIFLGLGAEIITGSPGCQFAGLATWLVSLVCKAESNDPFGLS